tara:strand:- start:3443 stop:3664 length:222 start_codon:yes stop_codon:yes gene_type:complete
MKYELTPEQLEEMVLCIVHNQLGEDEAMDYAASVCLEFMGSEEWPDDSRIDVIGQNGNDGLHYAQAHKAGVYD